MSTPEFTPLSEFIFGDDEQDLLVYDYSTKAFVIRGNTKVHKMKLKDIGAKYNPNLKGGPGWIFSKQKKDQLKLVVQKINMKEPSPTPSPVPSLVPMHNEENEENEENDKDEEMLLSSPLLPILSRSKSFSLEEETSNKLQMTWKKLQELKNIHHMYLEQTNIMASTISRIPDVDLRENLRYVFYKKIDEEERVWLKVSELLELHDDNKECWLFSNVLRRSN
jgi:hypothetical protein